MVVESTVRIVSSRRRRWQSVLVGGPGETRWLSTAGMGPMRHAPIQNHIDFRHVITCIFLQSNYMLDFFLNTVTFLLHKSCEFLSASHYMLVLDMFINIKKSCCLHNGYRFDSKCCPIVTLNGHSLPWVNELKYLGIFITSSRAFKCSLEHAKRAYYRSLNDIFGKIGRNASEEVILQLVASKCLPILMYGSEACCLKQSDIRSLDFAVISFLMKLFKTANVNVIQDCVTYFNFKLSSALLLTRTQTFCPSLIVVVIQYAYCYATSLNMFI